MVTQIGAITGYGKMRRINLQAHRLDAFYVAFNQYIDIVLNKAESTGKWSDDAPHLTLIRLVRRANKMVKTGLPQRR